IEQAQLLQTVLDALADQPVAALAVAAVLTWASHSSVAVVVMIMSLAGHGMVTPTLACALVLGANIGTAINPILETTGGGDPAARRLPLGNLGTRLGGCIVALFALPWLPSLMDM